VKKVGHRGRKKETIGVGKEHILAKKEAGSKVVNPGGEKRRSHKKPKKITKNKKKKNNRFYQRKIKNRSSPGKKFNPLDSDSKL